MKWIRQGVEKTLGGPSGHASSPQERRARPESERDFLAGEIPRVFDTPYLIHNGNGYHGNRDATY
jgi:hypothetical protein